MTKTKTVTWRCAECDTTGEAPTKRIALAALTDHFAANHNRVPWMDDES